MKIDYMNELTLPLLNKCQQSIFIEKADIMLAKNKELYEMSGKFLALLKSEFWLKNSSNKLEQWYMLSFSQLVAELAKKKITLTLTQKAEWRDYFEKQKATAQVLRYTIDATDHEIDHMVYALYGLTDEELQIVDGYPTSL